jgi:Cathepsin propeptide inhibitor domain (I29)
MFVENLFWYIRYYDFAIRYGKRYDSLEEIQKRFNIFVDSLKVIRSTNRKGLPYKLGVNSKNIHMFVLVKEWIFNALTYSSDSHNHGCWILRTEFADMSWEEFKTTWLGAAQNCSATLKGNHIVTEETLPETVMYFYFEWIECFFVETPFQKINLFVYLSRKIGGTRVLWALWRTRDIVDLAGLLGNILLFLSLCF